MIALLVPSHSLAVLASVRFLLAVLEEQAPRTFFDAVPIATDPRWLASVVAGAYVHGADQDHNIAAVGTALRDTADLDVRDVVVTALVEDIASRIG